MPAVGLRMREAINLMLFSVARALLITFN